MRIRRAVFVVLLVALLLGAVPAEPAAAVGATNVEFTVNGTLNPFPATAGSTTFSGSGTGAGRASALIGGNVYDATFTIVGGSVFGSAAYAEPGFPFCPLLGIASNDPSRGQVTLTGGATGVIARTGSLNAAGTVSNVNFTFSYAYVRVGATPVIVITGGWLTVTYFIPGSGWGSFTNSVVAGAGSGVFVVDPVQAATRCLTPGALPFTIVGNAVLATV